MAVERECDALLEETHRLHWEIGYVCFRLEYFDDPETVAEWPDLAMRERELRSLGERHAGQGHPSCRAMHADVSTGRLVTLRDPLRENSPMITATSASPAASGQPTDAAGDLGPDRCPGALASRVGRQVPLIVTLPPPPLRALAFGMAQQEGCANGLTSSAGRPSRNTFLARAR